MSKKRDFVEEILSIQSRNRDYSHHLMLILRLENLERLFKYRNEYDEELLKYFPIGLIACFEGYTRTVIKQLIDFGNPFFENIFKLKSIQLDFEIIKAIHQKTITFGDFISHLLPINNLSDINSHLSILTGKDFLQELKNVYDRFEVEVLNKEKVPILKDANAVYEGVTKTFELRHIFAHEIADEYSINPETIQICFSSIKTFIKATSEFTVELMYPNAPLTQMEMNIVSANDYDNSLKELQILENELESLLDEEGLNKFKVSKELWDKLKNNDAELEADLGGKGGTIWPTLYNSAAESIVRKRIEHIKETINFVKNM